MASAEQQYDAYMDFGQPEAEPWSAVLMESYLRKLGSTAQFNVAQLESDVEAVKLCYGPSGVRRQHTLHYGGFVGQPYVPEKLGSHLSDRMSTEVAAATLAVEGLFLSIALKQVDAHSKGEGHAWPAPLRSLIANVAQYRLTNENDLTTFRTFLTEEGKQDPVTRAVAHIFGVNAPGIAHNVGGDKFDSALAAAKFLEQKEAQPKSIVTVAAGIASTIPPQQTWTINTQDKPVEDHMGKLAERVYEAELTLSGTTYQPDWVDVNDSMVLGVHLAHRSIAPFLWRGKLAEIIQTSRALKQEELPQLRQWGTDTRTLAWLAGIECSAPVLPQSLTGSAPPGPQLYIPRDERGQLESIGYAYPPGPVYEMAVATMEANKRLANHFFQAHAVGNVFTACIATLVGEPEAPIPGFVDGRLWRPEALPRGLKANHFNEDEKCIYDVLMQGAHQTDPVAITPRRSPISGLIFGAVGIEGTGRLFRLIQAIRNEAESRGNPHPFSDHAVATELALEVVNAIGQHNFHTLIGELKHVAQYHRNDSVRYTYGRLDRLERLMIW